MCFILQFYFRTKIKNGSDSGVQLEGWQPPPVGSHPLYPPGRPWSAAATGAHANSADSLSHIMGVLPVEATASPRSAWADLEKSRPGSACRSITPVNLNKAPWTPPDRPSSGSATLLSRNSPVTHGKWKFKVLQKRTIQIFIFFIVLW